MAKSPLKIKTIREYKSIFNADAGIKNTKKESSIEKTSFSVFFCFKYKAHGKNNP